MDCPSPTPSPTVLCIDDIPQALHHRKATLESHGYRVQIASSDGTSDAPTPAQTTFQRTVRT